MNKPRPMLDPKALADRLQVSQRTIYRLTEDEKTRKAFGAVKVGGLWRFDPERVDIALSNGASK